MKALTVDFQLINQSMRDLSRDANDYYLDCSSGKVISLSRAVIKFLCHEAGGEASLLPDWDARMIPLAREIVVAGSKDYIRIPEAFGCPEHRWMSEFANQTSIPKLKEKLSAAMRGRGSCRRFKEILKAFPAETQKWNLFCSQRWQTHIQNWLEQFGILSVEENPRARAAAR